MSPLRPAELLERTLLGCACAATLATALLVARNRLAPYQSPLSFGLVFWGWFLAFYLVLTVPSTLLIGLVSARAARRWPRLGSVPSWLVGAGALAFPGVVAALNWRWLAGLFALDGPPRFRCLVPVAAAVSTLGLAVLSFPARRTRGIRRGLGLAAAASAAVALAPAAPPLPEPPRLQANPTGERLLFVGIDGADWRLADKLIERGELPFLGGLKARGAWARLETLQPTRSPEIWTTIFTGKPPDAHGVEDFAQPRLGGVNAVLPELRRVRGVGLDVLTDRLRRLERIVDAPVNADMRRVPAFWNIASAHATATNSVCLYPTWPAEPVTGVMATERVVLWPRGSAGRRPERLTHPPALYDELAALVVRPEDLQRSEAGRFMDVTSSQLEALRARPQQGPWDTVHQWDGFLARHETTRRIALQVMKASAVRTGVAADTLVWFGIVDQFSHTALRCSELVAQAGCADEERTVLARVASEAYRTADATLGELIAAFGAGNVLVLSDHGWSPDAAAEGGWSHRLAPEGIFVAAGPAFQPGRLEKLSVYDVLPLLLRLKGFAMADDMRGQAPEAAFAPRFLAQHAWPRIASYGKRRGLRPVETAFRKDEEVMQQLRALGYVQ